ncbi:MAG TPA: GNAT family N-acetyltransferase [Saprospiraceae bacterium]|nr:GNAT family N-acetyltransferase [Saprospiraceae bacterium]
MDFQPSTIDDLETIFQLYEYAIAHQKAVSDQHWLPFERRLVEQEIAEGRIWKIVDGEQIACVFMIAYNDPHIWGIKDADPAVYLHRIATHPACRGRNFVAAIIEWARAHGRARGKKYLRLDTWADNLRLKALYERCGFRFLGVERPANPAALPSHYSTIELGMFEMEIG